MVVCLISFVYPTKLHRSHFKYHNSGTQLALRRYSVSGAEIQMLFEFRAHNRLSVVILDAQNVVLEGV